MTFVLNELEHLIISKSEEALTMIAEAPQESLGDCLRLATEHLSIDAAKAVLTRQPDVMQLMSVKGFIKTPTPAHYYLCDDFDFFIFDDDEQEEIDEIKSAFLTLLLEHNANPNWKGKHDTVLDAAIKSAQGNLIKILITAGADVNKTQKGSALNVTISSIDDEQKRLQIFDILLKAGADVNGNEKYRPILTAAKENQIDTIKLLLASGADLTIGDENKDNLLDIACKNQQQNIIDFCATHQWFPDPEQQLLQKYSIAAKNLDFETLYEISKVFPENRLTQQDMINFSYAATQLKQHQDAITWVQKALNNLVNSLAVNRYIAALTYAAKFSEAIDCFQHYQNQVALQNLDDFAKANLLFAAIQKNNIDFIQIILNEIKECDSTSEGAGLLYFNAACVASMNNKLTDGFKFLVAARINQFKTTSIDSDPDLTLLRELPEFSVLQNWTNVGKDFYTCYDNDKELWYFQGDLFELDFAEQTCESILAPEGSPTDKAIAICHAILAYQQGGFNPVKRFSAALNSMVEDFTMAIIELLDTEEDVQYQGIRFEGDMSRGPLAIRWWASGILDKGCNDGCDENKYGRPFIFDSYACCGQEMYQALIRELKLSTASLFNNRPFYIQLPNPNTDDDERITLGI